MIRGFHRAFYKVPLNEEIKKQKAGALGLCKSDSLKPSPCAYVSVYTHVPLLHVSVEETISSR